MTETTLSIPEPIFSVSTRPESLSALIWRRVRRQRLSRISAIVLVLLALLVISAPLRGYSATDQNTKNVFANPSAIRWFGTDELGRDVFTRSLYGGQISLAVGIFSSLISLA